MSVYIVVSPFHSESPTFSLTVLPDESITESNFDFVYLPYFLFSSSLNSNSLSLLFTFFSFALFLLSHSLNGNDYHICF